MKHKFAFILIIALSATSCTSYRALEEERARSAQAFKDRAEMQAMYDDIKREIDSTEALRAGLVRQVETMKKDTHTANQALRDYLRLDQENKARMEQLSKTTDRILEANLGENERLLNQVRDQKNDLEKRSAELEKQKAEFEAQKAAYEKTRGELSTKEQRIQELQQALDNQSAAVRDLKNKVTDALTGFKASGLDVVERNGKVYVLLPEALLFKSGSKDIDPKGRDALRQLAQVLRLNPDINISVEGHTDNVPYRPKTANAMVEDNWDLSVLRATSVVKSLTSNGVSPLRIIAQGRGEYVPIDPGSTKEAKATNRRTEIILSPKLDELLKTIE